MSTMPYVGKHNGHPTLMVEDKPFILLSGEVHNSDSSSPKYMEGTWEIADKLGMNSLILPATWEMVEPEEGSFDFSVPMALIDQARDRQMRIVFLWFGSWKNAECMYAPSWVKMDLERFPRAQIEKGKNKAGRQISPSLPIKMPYTTLSYLGQETMKADAKAFAAFMEFLKEYDAEEHTVVAVQVENETGLLGAAREVSDAADAAFAAEVPAEFVAYMKAHTDTMTEEVRTAVENGASSGSWAQVFGACAEEIFSAYYTARFVNGVAEAGKAVYPLPLTVNCWLDKGGAPGSYPTGGPVSKVREVWDYCAPAIDVYCPDIYVPNFKEVADEYTRRGGALLIPEIATHSYAAPRLVYSVGHYHCMGYSPFGFDDIGKPFTLVQGFLFGMDVTDPALKTPQNFEEYAALGHILKAMMPMLADAYGTDRLQALSAETDPMIPHPSGNPYLAQARKMDFGSFTASVVFQGPVNPRGDGVCLCLKVSDNECYLVGNACDITLASGKDEEPNLDLLLYEEGCFDENGQWIPGRRLNGDESARMSMEKPTVWHVKFLTYC